ncbi:IS701 family transposase [Streptomyces sp. SP18CS02]|uniref:IS701 family transposase n=1 Tax=Streptomyces sp. SP18CS02 TaxID=3002531 RepID=UPI002E79E406|nr:transposase [Streptomyces sp. SP18CS02]MEE1757456.1 transposase [Streptomyces sp. SP18CS02]
MEAYAQHTGHVTSAETTPGDLPADVRSQLFASLRRSGQRLRAEQYVRGLLASPGRKTLRNIAAHIGGASAQQSLHHFISASPWEWMPVRRALARHVQRLPGRQAWVITPTAFPKAGSHSIGVDLQYMPHLGQTINGQQALGAWMASGRWAVPVDWQLLLPRRWLEDSVRRRANIPADAVAASLEDCIQEVADRLKGAPDVLGRPVVVDAEGVDAVELARRLAAGGHVFLIRTGGQTRLRIDGSVLPAYGERESDAGQLVASLTRLRKPVCLDGGGPVTAAAIPVVPTWAAAGRRGTADGVSRAGMLLVGEWSLPRQGDCRLWLTNAGDRPLPDLLRLTRLSDVVARDFAAISERVGVRDFAGRSFQGWHRHITLASVAHFAAVLGHVAAKSPAGIAA